jgi:hypothetical protein
MPLLDPRPVVPCIRRRALLQHRRIPVADATMMGVDRHRLVWGTSALREDEDVLLVVTCPQLERSEDSVGESPQMTQGERVATRPSFCDDVDLVAVAVKATFIDACDVEPVE